MTSTNIKSEVIDFENNCAVVSKSTTSHQHTMQSSSVCGNISSNAANSSPKMGSRRIFTPQFKLQVLESYRNDSDCKGNQRATARKYNIHRRQIQKWLQCESNLRSSVASINQTNVKHQFHNVTHEQNSLKYTVGSSRFSPQQHIHQKQNASSSESNRLNSVLNSITVPMHSGISTVTTSPAQGALAANLAAVVQRVVAAGASTLSTNTSTVTPIRPTAICGNTGSAIHHSSLSIIPHHQQTAQSYSLQYTHTPVNVPAVALPIISHHIAPLQHQYENLTEHTHIIAQPHGQYMPSYCLPRLPVSMLPSMLRERGTELSIDFNLKSIPTSPICLADSGTVMQNNLNVGVRYNPESTISANEFDNSIRSVSVTPIDLSVSHKTHNANNYVKIKHNQFDTERSKVDQNGLIVDLTSKKRKDQTANGNEPPEKILKPDQTNRKQSNNINVPPKQVKLFKPYLLGNEDKSEEGKETSFPSQAVKNEERNSIWSNQQSTSSGLTNNTKIGGNFQSPSVEKYMFHNYVAGNYTESQAKSPLSALSPLSVPALSPSCFRCSKGSPVSGYESSSSTYSDSSYRNEFYSLTNKKSVSVNFEVQSIHDETGNERNIQKWLDQESCDLHTTNASIALYAI